MNAFAWFTIGILFALIGCSAQPDLAARFPVWIYALGISSQLVIAASASLLRR